MSNPLAIAATTATLRSLLDAQVPLAVPAIPSSFGVTTFPPDVAAKEYSDEKIGLNLFLYQTVASAAWRNMDTPVSIRPGETGLPALALNLHYLITAYGKDDPTLGNVSQRILGAAMSVLHDHPLLGREEIKDALGGNDLGGQFERIRVTPLPVGVDELSKLWMMFQTQYRVSAVYEANVVLIDSRRPVKAALPVLRRGEEDRGAIAVAGGAATLTGVRPPNAQPSTRLGEDAVFTAENLSGNDNELRLTHQRTGKTISFAGIAAASNGEISIHVPSLAQSPGAMLDWTPGFYMADIVQKRPELPDRNISSNQIPFALAPRVTVAPPVFNAGSMQITLTCAPRARASQRVLLLFGSSQFAPVPPLAPPAEEHAELAEHVFKFNKPEAGDYVVRLRVDGVDSIPVVTQGGLPSFDPAQMVTVP
jgi:Pvc16 N-terminal domain